MPALSSLVALEGLLRINATVGTAQSAAAFMVPPSTQSAMEIPPDVLTAGDSRKGHITMPESWKRTAKDRAGAARADYWHGILEVYNSDGMRWDRPFPEKQEDVYRIMVVGDSLTYGQGLAEEWRFSNLAEQWLRQQFRIEFLNLGIQGSQSEDVLRVTKKHLPILRPNLVIYAVCLNDFLPSGTGEYSFTYPFPLPESWKTYLIAHTRTGAFLSEQYDGALRGLHLRRDFFDDVLADFEGYQHRFARDVAEMNRSVRSAGLPPLVALVVDQYPGYGGRGYMIAKIAEKALASAGAQVIEMEDYYRRYNGQAMNVSRWEGHPNEVANYIWASMIANELRLRPDLKAFGR
jgi:GDSL-like Lipase/Acylhydrolase family